MKEVGGHVDEVEEIKGMQVLSNGDSSPAWIIPEVNIWKIIFDS